MAAELTPAQIAEFVNVCQRYMPNVVLRGRELEGAVRQAHRRYNTANHEDDRAALKQQIISATSEELNLYLGLEQRCRARGCSTGSSHRERE
ncbi:hypothetical protein JCM5350_001550 [Sporobolomyces pararoseus]